MESNKIAELEVLYGHINDYSLAVYNGYDKHITIRHKETGLVYTQAYNLHKKGLASSSLEYKNIEYVLKCWKKFNNRYHYLNYKGFNKPVTIVDLINDRVFEQNAQTHFEGSFARQNTLNNFEVFKDKASKIFKDAYEYLEYDTSKRKVRFRNKLTNKVYEQLIHEHMKGSLCVAEIKDNSFSDLLKNGLTDLYNYSGYVDSTTPVKVTNKATNEVFYQLPKDIKAGRKPQSDCKYTIKTVQGYSDLVHNSRFLVLDLSEDRQLKLFDKITSTVHDQGIHEHVYGSLPKAISYSNCSRKELELVSIIRDLYPNLEVKLSCRPDWLNRKELDIYIPDLNLAIEYNGITYHHSSTNNVNPFLDNTYKDPEYHLNKFNTCLDNGVRLIHVFDYEVDSINLKQLIDDYLNKEIVKVENKLFYVCNKKLQICSETCPSALKVYRPIITFK